ncbi:serine-rich adhesin for platelets-like [Anneissia japonica]|uniref:serine-rich adhesin for platelets-like n=1 Tax=Anneissia japonica TaxID=1529436 RepID=UPI0014258CD2|nr:serine-rich adhesin for platelets-like [Anneissia japonica]
MDPDIYYVESISEKLLDQAFTLLTDGIKDIRKSIQGASVNSALILHAIAFATKILDKYPSIPDESIDRTMLLRAIPILTQRLQYMLKHKREEYQCFKDHALEGIKILVKTSANTNKSTIVNGTNYTVGTETKRSQHEKYKKLTSDSPIIRPKLRSEYEDETPTDHSTDAESDSLPKYDYGTDSQPKTPSIIGYSTDANKTILPSIVVNGDQLHSYDRDKNWQHEKYQKPTSNSPMIISKSRSDEDSQFETSLIIDVTKDLVSVLDDGEDIQLEVPSITNNTTDAKHESLSKLNYGENNQLETPSITSHSTDDNDESLSELNGGEDNQLKTPSVTDHSIDAKDNSLSKLNGGECKQLETLSITNHSNDAKNDLLFPFDEGEDDQPEIPSIAIDPSGDAEDGLIPKSDEGKDNQLEMPSITDHSIDGKDDSLSKLNGGENNQLKTPSVTNHSTDAKDDSSKCNGGEYNQLEMPLITDHSTEAKNDSLSPLDEGYKDNQPEIPSIAIDPSGDAEDGVIPKSDEGKDNQLEMPSITDRSIDGKDDELSKLNGGEDNQIEMPSVTDHSTDAMDDSSKLNGGECNQFEMPSITDHSTDAKNDSLSPLDEGIYNQPVTHLITIDHSADAKDDLIHKSHEGHDSQFETPSITDHLTDATDDSLSKLDDSKANQFVMPSFTCHSIDAKDDSLTKLNEGRYIQHKMTSTTNHTPDFDKESSSSPGIRFITSTAFHWIIPVILANFCICVVNANPDFIYQPPALVTAKEGNSMSLSCILNSEAESFKVVWTKDSYYINNPTKFDQDRFKETNETARHYKLIINPVTREDEGTYKCVSILGDVRKKTIFTSGCQLKVMKVPGPQYPQVILSKSQYSLGEDIVAYCISERVDQPSEITWIGSPGKNKPFQNDSHVGIENRIEASEKLNQTSFLCKMKVHKVLFVPRFKRSMPIVVMPSLQEAGNHSESKGITGSTPTTIATRHSKTTVGSGGRIAYISLLTIFTCLIFLPLIM